MTDLDPKGLEAAGRAVRAGGTYEEMAEAAIRAYLDAADNGWMDISTAEPGRQVIVWEPMYGWLLAGRSYDGQWQIKSSGNFWVDMPVSVVPELWCPLPSPPKPEPQK